MSNEITALHVDTHGTLWVGTNWGGFGTFDGTRFHRILGDITHWNLTLSFYESAEGTMWVGGNGDYRLYKVTGQLINKSYPMHDSIGAIAQASNGRVICCNSIIGISQISRTGQEHPYVIGTPTDGLTCMIHAQDGSLWIGSSHHGLYRYISNHLSKYTVRDGLPGNVIRTLYQDRQGILWIGTNNGIARWNGHKFALFDRSMGLSDSQVTAIFEDREGNLWTGAGSSLNRFAMSKLNPFTLTKGLTIANVPDHNGITPARSGGVWCATDLGLWHITPSHVNLVEPPGYRSDYVQGVVEGPDGVVWLIARSEDDAATFTAVPSQALMRPTMSLRASKGSNSPLASVRTVADHSSFIAAAALPGGLLAMCSGPKGTELLDIKPGRIIKRQLVDSGYVFAMTPDSAETLWVGCERGLITIKNGTVARVIKGMPTGTHVLGIDASDPRDVWVASDHGLGRIRDGRWQVYGTGAGLPDQNLYQVLRSGDSLWIGCNSGLFNISIRDIARFEQDETARIQFAQYTAGDGLRSFPNLYTAVKSVDGRLWFSGAKGITMVDPAHLYQNALRPPVTIENARVDRTSIGGGATVVPPGSGTLDVHFAAMTFQAPERVLFRYMLSGFDSDWSSPSGNRSVRYTNLPPGHYRFVVQAANNDGVWNRTGASISFELRPHYYQTTWFRAICLLVIFATVTLTFHIRSRQIILRNRELEQRVADRTFELQEANEELQAMHEELAAQNYELMATQETLAEANTQLEALATTDGLTGVKNHRAFRERLNREWERHCRSREPLSLILLDVDKFKQYNDTYGHPGGDEVLKTVARLLSEQARDCDFVARYGGEEFVIVAPSTDLNGAVHLAERLRAALETAEWPLRPVTASFGVATVSLTTGQAADLIAEADAALYRSKENGRNRVTHASQLVARAS